MKWVYLTFWLLSLTAVNAGVTRKQPQYSKPVYSNSYLPAAMQVIFYAVDQIRSFPAEEGELGPSTTLPPTSPHPPGQHQPTPTTPPPVMLMMQTEKPVEKPSQEAAVAESSADIAPSTPATANNPELSEETPEAIYATPETNHETPEASQEVAEPIPEVAVTVKPEDKPQKPTPVPSDEVKPSGSSEDSSEESEEKKKVEHKQKQPSIDSVVQEIYGIVQKNKSRVSSEESEESDSKESKESNESTESKSNNDDTEGGENEEDRFTMLGEKVTQVPRPSLLAYLVRARVTLRCSLEQLAVLYDALSKDARRQGFVKFSGYTDDVLSTLESSAEGGIGPQLQRLLEKIVERKEVTRDDTKTKIAEALKDLNEPGSNLNRDLRRLLPLKFKK